MSHEEIPSEYRFLTYEIKNIKTEKELIQIISYVVDVIRLLDECCEKNGWSEASENLKPPACELLELIRELVEKNSSKAA